jgi:Ala-tRNA(Pro) deacylase
LAHDRFGPSFADRSGLREGGKPASIVPDRASLAHDLFGKPVSIVPDRALMPATPDELFAYLDSLGIAHQTVAHPPVFTVEEARTLRGKLAGGHTKNLFLRDKKGILFLVVAAEDATIELKSLHRLLGATGRFSFGAAELLRETLGVEPGSVTPFAAINDKAGRVTVVLDAAMMTNEMLNFHPLTNTRTTTISRTGLLKFLEVTGHPPRIAPVAA